MLTRLGIYYWKLRSRLLTKFRFGHFGRGSWIRRPIAIINGANISIGDDCFIRDGARLEIVNRPGLPTGKLVIGNRVSIEQNAHIIACDEVIIEDDVLIAPRCAIVDTTHPVESSDSSNRSGQIDTARSSVHIGRRVFLGINVVVLPNVTIGENTVVGANSVVTHDLPANCVAVGSPAKVIRRF